MLPTPLGRLHTQPAQVPPDLPGLFARLGEVDRAIALIQAMTRAQQAGALISLADQLPALANPEQARRVSELVWSAVLGECAETPYRYFMLVGLSRGLSARGEQAEALRAAERAGPLCQLLVHADLAFTLASRGDRSGAREMAERARSLESGIDDDVRSSTTTTAVVRALAAAGDVEAALDVGCGSLGAGDLMAQVARTAAELGDNEAARAVASRCWTANDLVFVLSDLAGIAARSGDMDEATSLAARAQEVQTRCADFQRKDATGAIALALAATGSATAITWACRIADRGYAADLLTNVALALTEAGEMDAAKRAAESALKRVDDVTTIRSLRERWSAEGLLLNIACAYIAVGDTATAQRLVEPITSMSEACVQTRLARAMAAAGQTSEALATAERALALALADPAVGS